MVENVVCKDNQFHFRNEIDIIYGYKVRSNIWPTTRQS